MKLTDTQVKLVTVAGVIGVSFSAILVRYSTAPSMVLVLYRMFFAAIFMSIPGIPLLKKELPNLTQKDILCCLVSGIFLAFHFTCYFESVKRTSIASALVLVDSEVFFVSLVLLFFFHEKLSKKTWIGIIITFIGSIIVATGDASGTGGSLSGDLFALAGAICVGVYTIMGKVCRRHMSTSSYTMIIYWIASSTTAILLTASHTPILGYGGFNILAGLGMTVLCTLLGHNVFSWALKYVSPSFVSTAKLGEPVFSSLMGIALFMEIPSLTSVGGGILILIGIWLAA